MISQLTPEEIEKELNTALKNLRSPKKLSGSSLLSLCAIDKYQQANPTLVPSAVLKAFLTEILAALEAEHQQYGFVLRERFWEGKTAQSISLNKKLGERTLYKQQEKAQDEFFSLLWQREQACRQEMLAVVPISNDVQASVEAQRNELPPTPKAHVPSNPNRIPTFFTIGAMVLIFLGFIFVLFISPIIKNPVPAGTAMPSLTATISPSPTVTPTTNSSQSSTCGGSQKKQVDFTGKLLRHQGVSNFTKDNTPGILSNKVRRVVLDKTGLWIAYLDVPNNGFQHLNRPNLEQCDLSSPIPTQKINVIAVTSNGTVWVGTEDNGLFVWNGEIWTRYTEKNGLLNDKIYALTVDKNDHLWVGTWAGISEFDGTNWSPRFQSKDRNSIFYDKVHAIAFDSGGNIWVGHIDEGLSVYLGNRWVPYNVQKEKGLAGDKIRRIIVRSATSDQPESIWIATSDGGISRYDQGKWTIYRVEDGLPSNGVNDLALDRYHRVWAATDAGVAYFDGKIWKLYNTFKTNSIAIGASCKDITECPFGDDDHIWTATAEMGLTHSRLPLPEPAINVNKICFVTDTEDRKTICPPLEFSVDKTWSEKTITATYPGFLKPGERLFFEVTVLPDVTHQLQKVDFLSNTDESDDLLFQAHWLAEVTDTIVAGQSFVFTEDEPFVMPNLPNGSNEHEFVSTWRVWMHTKYVGPFIRFVFNVKNQ